MQSEAMKQEEIETLAREVAKGVKTKADLEAVTWTLTNALIETALKAEMTDHPGYEAGDPAGSGTGNSRNGTNAKTVVGKTGPLEIETPRDRNGEFEPQLVKNRQRRVTVIDEKIIPLHAKGMSTREIAATIEDLYGAEVSPSLISKVTEAVVDEVIAWQARPLNSVIRKSVRKPKLFQATQQHSRWCIFQPWRHRSVGSVRPETGKMRLTNSPFNTVAN